MQDVKYRMTQRNVNAIPLQPQVRFDWTHAICTLDLELNMNSGSFRGWSWRSSVCAVAYRMCTALVHWKPDLCREFMSLLCEKSRSEMDFDTMFEGMH